jgi:aspartyl-tRNA(Asn)/glutamyl-tRNA(Gln) amidotransferase subunit A
MIDPCMLPVAEMMRQIQRRKLSSVNLMESLLKRIDLLEPSLQAWVTIDRQGLLKEARRCHEEISRGKSRGPLHGIPIGVKDIFFTRGMKTTAGSKIFADFVPAYDATAVERLRKAGAIILGKTATTEFASRYPAPTRNPWNLEHTPGGSSSGSAAAVATGMCPAALGSQTGGSVLRPAAYCGVVGLKPTYGRISRHGVFALGWTLDHVGFLTRSVEDAAILLGILAGPDAADPTTRPQPVPDYVRSLRSWRRPPRIGIVRDFFQEKSEEPVWKHTEKIVSQLKRAGGKMREVKMPASFAAVQDAHRIIMWVEAAAYHEKLFEKNREKYSSKMREMVEIGLLIPSGDYLRAQKIKHLFRREMEPILQEYDCLLSPTTSSAAPKTLSSTGDPWFQVPWSLSGLPAITIPSGLNDERLPLGIQLAGAAFAEGKLLAIARWCEKVLDIHLSPPVERVA